MKFDLKINIFTIAAIIGGINLNDERLTEEAKLALADACAAFAKFCRIMSELEDEPETN